jgi:anthranilate synthase component 1
VTECRVDDRGAVRVPWVDPAALFVRGPAREPHGFWLDAGPDAREGWSHLGVGAPAPPPLAAVIGAGDDRLPGRFGGGWVGWFGYDGAAARAGAPAVVDADVPDTAGLDVAWFVSFDHARQEAWLRAGNGAGGCGHAPGSLANVRPHRADPDSAPRGDRARDGCTIRRPDRALPRCDPSR